MVTPTLRALAGPSPPFFPFDERWVKESLLVAERLLGGWEEVCGEAIRGGTAEELHAARDDYQTVLLAHLKILDGYLTLLSRFPDENPPGEPADRITRVRDRLQKHYDTLFPRWQSLDDLEAILLERISLPNARLLALTEKYPPPTTWYEEADDRLCSQGAPSATLGYGIQPLRGRNPSNNPTR